MILDTLIYILFILVMVYAICDVFSTKAKRTFWDHDRDTIGRREDRVISSFWAGEAARSWEKRHKK